MMKVTIERKLKAYDEKNSVWEFVGCPIRIKDEKNRVIFETSGDKTISQEIIINKLIDN